MGYDLEECLLCHAEGGVNNLVNTKSEFNGKVCKKCIDGIDDKYSLLYLRKIGRNTECKICMEKKKKVYLVTLCKYHGGEDFSGDED